MKRYWRMRIGILLIAALLVTVMPVSPSSVYAAENETITTSNLTVNAEVVDWVLSGAKPATFGDAEGSGGFDYWDSAPLNFTLTHEVTGLTPGTYTMKAKTFGSSGDPQDGSIMFADSGAETLSTPITYSGSSWGSPRTLVVKNIEVSDTGTATLGFTLIAAANHYGYIDEVTLTRVVNTNELTVNNEVVDWGFEGTEPATFQDAAGKGVEYWDAAGVEFSLLYEITGLEPGTYNMTAKTYGSNGEPLENSIMYAKSGDVIYSTPITYVGSGWDAPKTLTVEGIEVGGDGTAMLGITLLGGANHYGYIGDVMLEAADPGPELEAAPSSINMRPGKTQQITYEVFGGTVTGAVYYESSNSSAATVSADGLVTAIANGDTIITVTADTYEGGEIHGQSAIIVSDEWQQLGDTEIFVQPVPELQDGKRQDFIMGADISTINEIQKSGRKFYDLEGNEKPLMEILKENGVNWIRLRVWNDPRDEQGNWYGAGNTNKESVIIMAKQAKEAGLKVLIDFHYSDFWADPGRQNLPKAWEGLDEAELKQAVYDYTYDVINSLANENAYPDMVQIGNEINDGMLWPMGRTPAGAKPYIEQGIAAVRAVETDQNGDKIKILIHRANPNNGVDTLTSFYNNYADLDYDVIGLSFYPFWHGTFDNIKEVMNAMADTFDKEVVIAETSYGFTLEGVPNNGGTGQVFSESLQETSGYKAGVPGQATLVRDVIAAVAEVQNDMGLGVFYWEPAWLPGVDTGWATKEAADYQGEEIPTDGGSGWANQAMFNFFGEALPSIQVFDLVRASDDAYVSPSIEEIKDVTLTTSEGVNVPLPGAAKVLYADGAYRDVEVESWTPSTYDYNTAGSYTAEGTLAGGGTVTANITVRPLNYVANPSLEDSDMSAWELVDSYRHDEVAYTGEYAIHFWNSELVSAKQTITDLPAGIYNLSMRSRIGANADPIGESYLYAEVNGERWDSSLIVSGWSTWNLNTIENIEVRGRTLEIGAVVNQSIEAGGDFDDWELIKIADLPGSETPGEEEDGSIPDAGTPQLPEQTGKKVITNPQANAEGKIAVSIAKGEKQVLLPANAAAIDGKNDLNIVREDVEANIPAEVLAELKSLDSSDLEGAQIAFSMTELSNEAAVDLLNKAKDKSNADLTAAGEVFEFDLSIVDKEGNSTKLSTFKQPITLKLKVGGDVNTDLLGVYYIADDGQLEFVGGTLVDGFMVVNIHHFSKYAVLEYDKSFADVDDQYWAYNTIKKLAAKHIVTGVSDTEFAPKRRVTRAEFTAFIVRALGLEATKEASFTDVDSSKWYAEAVASAFEAGIVSGRSADIFAPNAEITRQEMAIMIVSAYEVRTGKAFTASSEATFADSAEISAWAQDAVNAAAELGFIQGRENNQFAPQDQANRAESAQIISLLLK
jgi:arabinogalactan endo-1,4-beta-galactosidase